MPAISSAQGGPRDLLEAEVRWRWPEIAFWSATALPFVVTPDYLQLASQIAITALFALSLDLILGYAGIVSLGHAAFFGFGSYTAGLLAKWGWGEPLSGLLVAGLAAGVLGYATSFIIARFRHLALIMITLGLGLLRQLSYGIIKPGPVAAFALKQSFECGNQFVVGGLGRKAGVVGLCHPAVVTGHLGGGGLGRGAALWLQPALAQRGVVRSETLHCFTFYSC